MSASILLYAFHWPEILFVPCAFVFAFIVASIVGGVKGEKGAAVLRGLESGLLSAIGAVLCPFFVGLLLLIMGGGTGAKVFIGWGFFLWPGAIDSIPAMIGAGPYATSPDSLFWIARCAGAFAGMFDGLWKIHNWAGAGWITFLIDYTWGLAGTVNGALFHLFNFLWAGHADQSSDERHGAHVYASGFRFKTNFAVTQGNVMSDMGSNRFGSTLFTHEKTHVLQNRVFGPFYTLTYLGWMAVMLVPALIAAAITKNNAGTMIEGWCYYSNPWETWAYSAAGQTRSGTGKWSGLAVIIVSIFFFAAVIALTIWGAVALWS